MADQALVGANWRRATSEGSLLLMVAVDLDAKQSQRGGERRGEHERADKGGGGGSMRFDRGRDSYTRL